MDRYYEEEVELKVNEHLEKYQELIKKIEEASLQIGITLEDGIKFLYCLCTNNYS